MGERRCDVTHNLCGTDTWPDGDPCRCVQCKMWVGESHGGASPAVEGRNPTPASDQRASLTSPVAADLRNAGDAPPCDSITFQLTATTDAELTCIFCGRQAVTHEFRANSRNMNLWHGIHAECGDPFLRRNPKATEANGSPELANLRRRVEKGNSLPAMRETALALLSMVDALTEELRRYRSFVDPTANDGPTGDGPYYRHDEMKALRGLIVELRAKLAESDEAFNTSNVLYNNHLQEVEAEMRQVEFRCAEWCEAAIERARVADAKLAESERRFTDMADCASETEGMRIAEKLRAESAEALLAESVANGDKWHALCEKSAAAGELATAHIKQLEQECVAYRAQLEGRLR